jgi:hypothetical protein
MKIANIPLAVIVDGVRRVIPAGTEIPDGALGAHDEKQLLASKALRDPAAEDAKQKAQADAKARANAEFQAARKAVQEAAESVNPPEPEDAPAVRAAAARQTDPPGPGGAATATAKKTTGKK